MALLSGCVQSTTMVGPAVTLVSSGNIGHAGLSLGANKAVENETGMSTTELIVTKFDESQKIKPDEELLESLKVLLDLNLHKTRKELSKN